MENESLNLRLSPPVDGGEDPFQALINARGAVLVTGEHSSGKTEAICRRIVNAVQKGWVQGSEVTICVPSESDVRLCSLSTDTKLCVNKPSTPTVDESNQEYHLSAYERTGRVIARRNQYWNLS